MLAGPKSFRSTLVLKWFLNNHRWRPNILRTTMRSWPFRINSDSRSRLCAIGSFGDAEFRQSADAPCLLFLQKTELMEVAWLSVLPNIFVNWLRFGIGLNSNECVLTMGWPGFDLSFKYGACLVQRHHEMRDATLQSAYPHRLESPRHWFETWDILPAWNQARAMLADQPWRVRGSPKSKKFIDSQTA